MLLREIELQDLAMSEKCTQGGLFYRVVYFLASFPVTE